MSISTFGKYGVWAGYNVISPQVSSDLEQLGIGAVWLGGSPQTLTEVRAILEATTELNVATGITNIWNTDPAQIAKEFAPIEADHPGRFILGVGAGHREATKEYAKPYEAVVNYLDVLDSEGLGKDHRVLAALGPRMLRLARDRSLGAHPYLTTPEHTREARSILGSEVFLAPEQKIVPTTDPQRAREVGGKAVDQPYLHLKNYTDNLRRLGFNDDDFAGGGSDRVIDALVGYGESAQIKDKIDAHSHAGASHVAIQVLSRDIVDAIRQLDLLSS